MSIKKYWEKNIDKKKYLKNRKKCLVKKCWEKNEESRKKNFDSKKWGSNFSNNTKKNVE